MLLEHRKMIHTQFCTIWKYFHLHFYLMSIEFLLLLGLYHGWGIKQWASNIFPVLMEVRSKLGKPTETRIERKYVTSHNYKCYGDRGSWFWLWSLYVTVLDKSLWFRITGSSIWNLMLLLCKFLQVK